MRLACCSLLFAVIFAGVDSVAAPSTPAASGVKIILENQRGLRWEFQRGPDGWALGAILLHGRPVEAPARSGLLFLRELKTQNVRWLAGSEGEVLDDHRARFSGQSRIEGATFSYVLEVALREDSPAAALNFTWSVDRDLEGWEVGLTYQEGFAHHWRCQSYPFAGNSEAVAITPMRYCGVPGALMYRPDLSLAILFTIDSRFDYLNPTTWTRATNLGFKDQEQPPQFCVGGGKLSAATKYTIPLQLFFDDAGEFTKTITGLVRDWIRMNDYRVDESLFVRTPDEALKLFLEGRRKTDLWVPGVGYEMGRFLDGRGYGWVYLANTLQSAYLEYRLYELTGDSLWRQRAFEQMEFLRKAQVTDPADPNYGAVHTTYQIRDGNGKKGGTFHSKDWAHEAWKVDMMSHAVRYALMTWERVKAKEGLDRKDWFQPALLAAEWVMKQRNPDGGLPQAVYGTRKSNSTVCARTLVAMPVIARITGDQRYLKFAEGLEQFLRAQCEARFWFTGAHPDLPPNDFEQDSLWNVMEYWLDKHDRTGQAECLAHATATAYYALLHQCPKQLSWVEHPTQGANTEQVQWNMYVVYCYDNRKVQSLHRLAAKTGNPLFKALFNRFVQLNFYNEVATGPNAGAFLTGVADPWLERVNDNPVAQRERFNYQSDPYMNSMNVEMMMQLLDLSLIRPAGQTSEAPR